MEPQLTQTTLGCGVTDHADDCLCDVVVTEITPINFGGHEVDHADLVIKYRNLGAPWTSSDMAELIEALGRAAEAKALLKDAIPDRLSTYTSAVKGLIAEGHSMIDIPNIIGLPLADCAAALMSGRTSAVVVTWSESDWLAFEADCLTTAMGNDLLSRRHNVSNTVALRLSRLYRASLHDHT
jgi:hypothetical protein